MRNIIVIGASAGGITTVKELLSGLQDNLDAAFFVVQHVSRDSSAQNIVEIFQKHTSLICKVASDSMLIEAGKLYLAPPDHHLILDNELLMVTNGARENNHRPSIDVLFRSAAVNFGNRVIGIILTGMMEDGTSGMSAVSRCGGICIVQNPADAQFFSMPQSVLNNVVVDYNAALRTIPQIIHEVLAKPLPPAISIPEELRIEADITKRMMSNIDELKSIGDRSDFICPECGGGLWALKNDPASRYRCHTGHVYTEKLLQDLQQQGIEESVWVSIRMLEERVNMLKLTAVRQAERPGERTLDYSRRIRESSAHIERLKNLLADLSTK
jgi:two-component system chemotaxis response regulator CheB